MKNKGVKGSIVAGRDVKNSVNANDSKVYNHSKIVSQARKQAFWVSLITGIVSSFIASVLYRMLIG